MRIIWLQLLRAVAAMLVLFGHTLGAASRIGGYQSAKLATGLGVDIFFVISGFIMVFASDRLFTQDGAARQFLGRRVARVVPLYWVSTTAIVVLILLGSKGWSGLPSTSYIASSYLFIPNDEFGSVDGIAFPLLSLGWTLNYEMLFYVIFSVFLFLPRNKAVGCTLITMATIVLVGAASDPASIILQTWSQPIILEFALGMVLGCAFLQNSRLPRPVSVILLVLAITWIVFDPLQIVALKQTPNDFSRLFGWGMPAFMIVASAILTPWSMPAKIEKPALLLGDSSYSLYLTHPFVLIALEKIWPRIFGPHLLSLMVVFALTGAIVLAVIVRQLIEAPLDAALKRALTNKRSSRLATQN
jgi:peptidoglycan/LPS O-acetylase OafA/YrhL